MKLVLLGGGGHCRSCIDAILCAGFKIAGVVDPSPVLVPGVPWLGDDGWLNGAEARGFCHLVTVGQVKVSLARRRLFAALRSKRLEIATVTANSAVVSDSASLGAGSVVLHRAVVNAYARVGENCIINTGGIVEHDARIGNHCHISTGAIINGGAELGTGCVIGSGAVVLQGVKIAADVMVGAGAVVTRDIDGAGTWIGVPARRRP